MNIEVPRERIEEFRRKWKIREFTFFGSVLGEDFRPESDVDVLVSFDPDARRSWSERMELEEELAGLLGRKVDVVEKRLLRNPFIRHHVLSGDRSPLRPEDRDPAYLFEMRELAGDAWKFGGEATRERVEVDNLLRDALCYVLQRLSRFAGKVSPRFRAAHPEIPWDRLAPLDDAWRLADVAVDELWRVFHDVVPGLAERIDALVPPLPEPDSEFEEALDERL